MTILQVKMLLKSLIRHSGNFEEIIRNPDSFSVFWKLYSILDFRHGDIRVFNGLQRDYLCLTPE